MEIDYRHITILVVYALVEYWLGRTRKVQSNSTVEMVIVIVIGLFSAIIYVIERIKHGRNKS